MTLKAARWPLLLPQPNMRELAIVGNNAGINLSPVFQSNKEIWVTGAKGPTLPRFDAAFQMHQSDAWLEGHTYHRNWLYTNTTIPVYMRAAHPEIPMSIAYPFETAISMLRGAKLYGEPLKYFTSSPAYEIALAILFGFRKIELLGMDMVDAEYERIREGFAFWVGFAAGRGIDLEINCADNIFNKPLYGAQREP